MKIKIILLSFILLSLSVRISAQVMITGAFRNDAALIVYDNMNEETGSRTSFNDALENKLILRYQGDSWRFYGDGRLYLFYGDIRNEVDAYEAKLMRSFVRYSPAIGDFTLGKTYVNLGNPGLFNPFEFNKQVMITDPGYDKEGMPAIEYDIPIGDLSGCKLFAGTYESEPDPATYEIERHHTYGIDLQSNISSFDYGIVAIRKRKDTNEAGFYFKGDLFFGVQGAYSYHFFDDFKRSNVEANFGLDYSFLGAHVIISSIVYFNNNGAENEDEYTTYFDPDVYFRARFYDFSNIIIRYDEFLSFELGGFVNLVDFSSIIYPSVTYVLADGLSVTGAVYYFTGKGDQEFSGDIAGMFNGLLRVEAKF